MQQGDNVTLGMLNREGSADSKCFAAPEIPRPPVDEIHTEQEMGQYSYGISSVLQL